MKATYHVLDEMTNIIKFHTCIFFNVVSERLLCNATWAFFFSHIMARTSYIFSAI